MDSRLAQDVIIELINDSAKIPQYMTVDSAGADLHAAEEKFIKYGGVEAVSCGFKMQIPPGYEVQIRPRSGLSLKGITVANAPGTIDADYRGEIKVILHNFGYIENSLLVDPERTLIYGFQIKPGDRIAQMVLTPVRQAKFTVGSVDETVRGAGGFGSTGK